MSGAYLVQVCKLDQLSAISGSPVLYFLYPCLKPRAIDTLNFKKSYKHIFIAVSFD